MTAFSLHHAQMHRLLCSPHRRLDLNSSVTNNLPSFHSDLLRKLASWRDDERPNISSACPAAIVLGPTLEVGIPEDALDNWHQKGQSLTSASLRLCNHVGSV